ncbi:YbaB/EbfC family nucleoid-associated protein [Actinoallomurus acaciae]|uniref:YbaB/EbfC family nucleoid-associated protein n=1 Tax=Actinoallomurus acaciae TaxID=502577 RepID=A0ABV5YTK8_9ACTN
MDADREKLQTELHALEERSRKVREELSAVAIEAKSNDGLIELTVGGQGRLHALTLDPRVKRLDVEELAERLVGMTNDALDLLQHETAAKMREAFPEFTADPPFGDQEGPWRL